MRTHLSLVLPAFNEQAGIAQAVAEADEALSLICDDYEVIVVDDGSRDDTTVVVQALLAKYPKVRLIRHEKNRGYGAALRTGFEAARFDQIGFTDADCQFHLDDLSLLLDCDAPLVVGYRVDRKDPWRRRFLSRGYNLLARTLLGTTVRDIDCALKVFRRDALRCILPESPGFFVNTEMLTRARQEGLEVAEVGVRHRARVRGQSTVSLREVPRTLGRLLPFWWSKVLFGAPVPIEPMPERHGGRSLQLLLVLLLACLMFFVRLRAPLLEPQEARYAEIPRLMLAEGRLIVPTLHEQDYLDKPPLLYWCVMACYQAFGVSDWSARLVPGFSGVLTVSIAFFWGRRVFGPVPGLCGAVLLCLTPEFVYRGRMLTFDTLLMLWVTAALAAAHLAMLRRTLGRGWWVVSTIACGLGLLTKGPIALALVVPPLVLVGLLDRRLARPGWRAWLVFVSLSVIVAAPWYVAMSVVRPDFVTTFIWKHHVERFVTPFDHAKPVWFYLPGLALGLLPWLLLVPALVKTLCERSEAKRRPGALGLMLACFVWTLVFFSASGCKRPTYMLPALPPLALALGWLVATRAGDWRSLLARNSRLAAATAGLALIAGVCVALAAALTQTLPPAHGFVFAGAALVGLAALVCVRRIPWAAATLLIAATLFTGVREALPAYNDQFALRGQLRRLAGEPERDQRPVVCYPMRYDSVSFYLRGGPVRVFGYGQKEEMIAYLKANPDSLVVIKSGSAYRDVMRDLPTGLALRTQGQRGAIVVGRIQTQIAHHESNE